MVYNNILFLLFKDIWQILLYMIVLYYRLIGRGLVVEIKEKGLFLYISMIQERDTRIVKRLDGCRILEVGYYRLTLC